MVIYARYENITLITMNIQIISLLIIVAMAGTSCTGSAQTGNSGNDTTTVMPQEAAPQAAPEDSICNNPDVRPKYDAEDSMTFLLDFLNKNLHYPEEAIKKELQGTVIVQMVVEKDGTPTYFEIIREVDPLLDNEALRVAKLLPKFVPAQKDGKPVRCIFNFSIPYRL